MKLQHKGQKYRKWRVIKWQRAQTAARLLPCWDRQEEDILAQIRAQREAEEYLRLYLVELSKALNCTWYMTSNETRMDNA